MKKMSLFFVTLAVVLGFAVSGCYYERSYERPHYHHYQHDHDHDHYRDHDRY
ncbi:MAG: hypothetical protein Q8891_10810 [Bacteroidota bacterium]|nr:hypothetical protein [Bacteroidota bacterium]